MNKICTSVEQSRKLIELGIDTDTADMLWTYDFTVNDINGVNVISKYLKPEEKDIPAWSLTALMNVLDRGALFKTPKGWACQFYIEYKAITGNYYSNPVDACFEIVLKFHELKML